MKRFFTSLALVAITCSTILADEFTMMVFSDPHVLHQSLIPTADASTTFGSGLMLTEYSQELFDAAVNLVRDQKPEVLLIPGDMIYNGDSVSHRYVATQLNTLVANGIRVFVIPGNHDINEPGAKSYTSVSTGPVTLRQYRELYAKCGYEGAEAICPDSISYMTYLGDSTALIAINSAVDNRPTHQSAGGIDEMTLQWVEQMAAKAIEDGRYPIAMTHHQLLKHFDHQNMIDDDHIANSNENVLNTPSLNELQTRLADAGIIAIFTGHMHIHSIKDVTTQNGRVLYDISTNCLSGYGAAIRTIRMQNGGFAELQSSELPGTTSITYEARQTMALSRLQNMANKAFNSITAICVEMLGNTTGPIVAELLKPLIQQYLLTDYTQLFANLSAGDEYNNPDAAFAFREKCLDDFDNMTSALMIALQVASLRYPELNAVKEQLEGAINDAKGLLMEMVSSIMYNCTDWNYDAVKNRIADSNPTIIKPYYIENPGTAIEQVNMLPNYDKQIVYTIDGRQVGTRQNLNNLPQGVYIVNGVKIIR